MTIYTNRHVKKNVSKRLKKIKSFYLFKYNAVICKLIYNTIGLHLDDLMFRILNQRRDFKHSVFRLFSAYLQTAYLGDKLLNFLKKYYLNLA